MKIEDFEVRRLEANKKANKFILIGVVVALIIGVIAIASQIMEILVVGIFIGFVIGATGMHGKIKLQKELKNTFITSYIKTKYPTATYYPNQGLRLEQVMACKMISRPDRFSSEDYVSDTYKGVKYMWSDIRLEEKHVERTKNGTRVYYTDFFKGRFYIFDFQREFPHTIQIIEKSSNFKTSSGLKKIELESLDFNKKFSIHTSNEHIAFYILTPQIQEKLLELEAMHNGKILFSFMNGLLYIGINDGINSLEIPLNKELNSKTIDFVDSQIDLPLAIINELKLDSDKFSSQMKL